jgi:hypothetical protein
MKMRDEVATGQRLQQAMENTDLFPNMVIQMIAVGEESGSLDEMSAKVADFYEEDVDNAVDNLSSLLEPLPFAKKRRSEDTPDAVFVSGSRLISGVIACSKYSPSHLQSLSPSRSLLHS